jgi:hypothetical protein
VEWPSNSKWFYLRLLSTHKLRAIRADSRKLVELGYNATNNAEIVQATTAALTERGER